MLLLELLLLMLLLVLLIWVLLMLVDGGGRFVVAADVGVDVAAAGWDWRSLLARGLMVVDDGRGLLDVALGLLLLLGRLLGWLFGVLL